MPPKTIKKEGPPNLVCGDEDLAVKEVRAFSSNGLKLSLITNRNTSMPQPAMQAKQAEPLAN